MMNKKSFIWAFSILLFSDSCDQVKQNDELDNDTILPVSTPKEEPQEEVEENLEDTEIKKKFSLPEKVFLESFNKQTFGSSFQETKEKFPTLNEIEPENDNDGKNEPGFTESSGVVMILGYQGHIEFNFKNDSLYSYSISIQEPSYEKAENLHETIQNYYSKKYGKYENEAVEEENRFVKTCYWSDRESLIKLFYNVNSGEIKWTISENIEEETND